MGTAHLSVLIKPASSLCNLRCGYCFYHDLAESRDIGSYGIMKPETAEALIEKAVEAAQKSISFAFQGGEPSLAGLDIFEYFTACVSEKLAKNQKKLQINYSIQTNGVGITEDFAKFLKAHKFLVGLSLDGVREINDYYRVDATGQGTHGKIIKTAQLFDRLGVDYNILTVVSSQTARHIKKIYNYYKAQGFSYLQFIPCLEPLGAKPFSSRHFLSPALYERFLTDLFLLWHGDFAAGRYISIRFFDNLVRIAAGQPSEQCGTLGFCAGQFVVEADGSVFPCDFYCVDNWKTGNILNTGFDEIYASSNMQKFLETSLYAKYSEAEREKCEACKVSYLCRGGCRRDRDCQMDGIARENIYCEALFGFYSFAEPYLKDIAKKLVR